MGLLLAAALSAGCGPPGQARPAPGQAPARRTAGQIVFSSNRSGPWRIWVVNLDGTGMSRLADGGEGYHDVDPVFSPDGKCILFTSTRGGKTGVWIMSRDGSGPRRICDGDQAEWSPDGQAIVLRREGRIVTRRLVGGAERTISPGDWTGCSGPAWGPDGKSVAFACRRGGANGLYLVAADGGRPATVCDQQGACEPHWSPDGTRIVYETETNICTISPDGTNNRLVTYYGGVQRYARWSGNGAFVVFCQAPSPEGPWEIYTVPAAGGPPTRITRDGSDMYPDVR